MIMFHLRKFFQKFMSFKIKKVIDQWVSRARKVTHRSPHPVIVSNPSSPRILAKTEHGSVPEAQGRLADLAWGSRRKCP